MEKSPDIESEDELKQGELNFKDDEVLKLMKSLETRTHSSKIKSFDLKL